MSNRGLATKKEAADYLSVGVRTIERLVAEGELDQIRIRNANGSVRITWRSLEQYAKPKPRKKARRQTAASSK